MAPALEQLPGVFRTMSAAPSRFDQRARSFVLALLLHAAPILVLLADYHSPDLAAQRPQDPAVKTFLVPPIHEARPAPPPNLTPTLNSLAPQVELLAPESHRIGPVTFRWERDPKQHLRQILQRRGGSVGFAAEGGLVTHRFVTPGWRPDALPEEGVKLGRFFALLLDPNLGTYGFLTDLRSKDGTLQGLAAYALFDKRVQIDLEDDDRAAAKNKCGAGDDLDATLRLDPDIDFRIVDVRCVKRKEEPAK